jgi:hypothetical protein
MITETVTAPFFNGRIQLTARWRESNNPDWPPRPSGTLSGFRGMGFTWTMVDFPPLGPRAEPKYEITTGVCARCNGSIAVTRGPLSVRHIWCDCARCSLSSPLTLPRIRRALAVHWPEWLVLADRIEELANLLRTDTHESLYGSGYEGYEDAT